MFKRGELPDDDRPVPNWLRIKNDQLDCVDLAVGNADDLVAMSSEEFNELIGSDQIDNDVLLVYLSTLSPEQLERFYRYLDETVTPGNDPQASARSAFQSAVQKVRENAEVSEEARQRAFLQMPMNVRFAQSLYRQSTRLHADVAPRYFDYTEGEEKRIEGHLNMALFEEMKYVPTCCEQTLDFMRDRYFEAASDRHRRFAEHLCDRFGYLIYNLYRLNHLSQLTEAEPGSDSLSWFVASFLKDRGLDISTLEESDPLIYYTAELYGGIADGDDDLYLAALLRVVLELLSYYPLNAEAAEYALIECMKSVALKTVSPENARTFLNLFHTLPHLYDRLDFATLMRLKERINHTIAEHKPHENRVFKENNLHTIVLLNYLIDMEDLFVQES